MASDDDNDRTMFGQKLPPQPPKKPDGSPPIQGQGQGQGQGQAPGQAPPLPPQGQQPPPGQPPSPFQQPPAQGQPNPYAAPQQPAPQPPQNPPAAAPPDADRTMFGMQVPRPGQSAPRPTTPQPPAGYPPPPQQPAPPYPPQPPYGQGVYGAPPQGQPPAPGQPPQGYPQGYAPNPPQHPTPQPPAQPGPGAEDTWFGGRMPGQPGPPSPQYPSQQPPQAYGQPQPPYPPQSYGQPPQAPSPQDAGHTWLGQPLPGHAPAPQPVPGQPGYAPGPQFPDASVQPAPPPQPAGPKIAFTDALRGAGLDVSSSTNPIVAAAADLLILLGRLRTGLVEMQAVPLRDHVVREIGQFVQRAQEQGISPEDIRDARYALAATADDIVQKIPGADVAYWTQYSMAAELLNDRNAGIGFFTVLEQVMAYPSQRQQVLELLYVCLSLGFEGKYRTEANGLVMLSRIRQEVYQRLRSVTARPEPALSHKWLPVVLNGKRASARMPLWIVGAVAGAMVVAVFASLSWILSNDAQAANAKILAMHDRDRDIQIERAADTGYTDDYEADTTGQLERILAQLAPDIEAGTISVAEKGDYIAVRLGRSIQFRSGSSDLQVNIDGLIGRIGAVLEGEPGEIILEGHSDTVPLRGTGRYRTNEALSEARAQTVRDVLASYLSDAARMSVIGLGPAEPLDLSGTREAHATNRRVEILLKQEQKL